MSAPLSHQQLAMWMTPEEIKSHGVHDDELDYDETPEELWDRKRYESHDWDNHGIDEKSSNLAEDIKKHGVKTPVTFNLNTNKLSDGHHRVASAKPRSLIPVEYEE